MSLSFPKKNVDKPTNLHLNFSNILPKQIQSHFIKDENLLIRDINYDDRIRFPRMRTVNVYAIGSSDCAPAALMHPSSTSSFASVAATRLTSSDAKNVCGKSAASSSSDPQDAKQSASLNVGHNTSENTPQSGTGNIVQNTVQDTVHISGQSSVQPKITEAAPVKATDPRGSSTDTSMPQMGPVDANASGDCLALPAAVADPAAHRSSHLPKIPECSPVQPLQSEQTLANGPKMLQLINFTTKPTSSTSSSSSSSSTSPINYNFSSHSPSTSNASQLSLRKSSQTSEQTNFTGVDVADPMHVKSDQEYVPAKFDLSKPLRRFSCQLILQDHEILQEYTANNCIYQKDHQITTVRSCDSAKDTNLSSSSSSSLSTIVPPLSQLYQCKKPLGTPAVLRPIKSTTVNTNQLSLNQFNYGKLAELPPNLNVPTTQHWKPNNFTNHCMRCSIQFTSSLINFIHNNIISKHHCRFCGGIFCQLCLVDSQQVMLDEQGRFIFNLQQDSENDRSVKVCSKCSYMYNFLQQELIKLSTSGWFFVDNPGINPKFSFTPMKMVEEDSRKPPGEIPSDWTWSSF